MTLSQEGSTATTLGMATSADGGDNIAETSILAIPPSTISITFSLIGNQPLRGDPNTEAVAESTILLSKNKTIVPAMSISLNSNGLTTKSLVSTAADSSLASTLSSADGQQSHLVPNDGLSVAETTLLSTTIDRSSEETSVSARLSKPTLAGPSQPTTESIIATPNISSFPNTANLLIGSKT